MSDSFIVCDGLVKIFQVADLEMVALRELNLTIEKSELIGIVGSSGSGKSTLMNILGGLDRPTAGRVRVGNHDLLKMSDSMLNRYRREEVGFVWQQSARNLVPYLNALDNVTLPMTLSGLSVRNKKRQAGYLLDMVGLGERKHHHLPELSGGEQQRVAIAVALANEPTLLLADEPTGEVDSATAKTIYETFQTLTREIGLTTVIVSHDPGVARQVDRVVSIRDGMLASETVRQSADTEMGEGEGSVEDDEAYAELVVVDNSGRLHIPPDYLEQFDFSGRARIDVTEDGLLIRPHDASPIAPSQPRDEPKQGLWSNLIRSAAQKRSTEKSKTQPAAQPLISQQPISQQPVTLPGMDQPTIPVNPQLTSPQPINSQPINSQPVEPQPVSPQTVNLQPENPQLENSQLENPQPAINFTQPPLPPTGLPKAKRGLKGRMKNKKSQNAAGQNYPAQNYPDPNYPTPDLSDEFTELSDDYGE